MYINSDIKNSDLPELDLITDETPIGWSSTCLDQTLFYYLECSHASSDDNHNDSLNN